MNQLRLFLALVSVAPSLSSGAAPLVEFDFGSPATVSEWQASHDVAPLQSGPDGLAVRITGPDPFITGPVRRLDSKKLLNLQMRLRAEAGGWAQLFFFETTSSEARSIWFPVFTNRWTDVCVPLPLLSSGTRFRFDPPGSTGLCHIARWAVSEADSVGLTRVTATPTQLALVLAAAQEPVDLVELQPFESLSAAAVAPVVGRSEAAASITLPRFATNDLAVRDRLYSGFVAVRHHPRWGRVPVGPTRFVEDFAGVSKYSDAFPQARSKKGLQIQMVDDAIKLGVQHAAINLNLSGLVDLTRNPANFAWPMDGVTYYFKRGYVENLPVKTLTDAGCVVSVIVLAYQGGNPELNRILLHPQRTSRLPNGLAGFNTATGEGLRHFKACLEFLADRFSQPDRAHGRVANYIIGNEVTAHWEWYNLGRMPREPMIAEYERAVRVAHTAVRKFSASSRVYLSFEHHWTIPFDKDSWKGIPGRSFVDEFARVARLHGDFDWHMAYHPYPENLFQPRTWRDKSALPTFDTPRITFKNLDQLEQYFHRPELLCRGVPRRIILSEQGFHSDGTPAGDLAQAAAYCYAWRKVAVSDGIDSFILHRHVDHGGEFGLNLGLWRRQTNSVCTASTPRPMYEVFRQADTPGWEAAFRFALPILGLTNWAQLAPAR